MRKTKKTESFNSNINKNKASENFNNDNLFKEDSTYKMNKDLTFDSIKEEANCTKDMILRYKQFLSVLAVLILIKTIVDLLFVDWGIHMLMFILKVMSIIPVIFVNLLLKNNLRDEEFKNVRILMEMHLLIVIAIETTTLNSFELALVLPKFSFGLLYNLLLATSIKTGLVLFLIEGCVIIASVNDLNRICVFAFFSNLVTFKILIVMISIITTACIQYLITKVIFN